MKPFPESKMLRTETSPKRQYSDKRQQLGSDLKFVRLSSHSRQHRRSLSTKMRKNLSKELFKEAHKVNGQTYLASQGPTVLIPENSPQMCRSTSVRNKDGQRITENKIEPIKKSNLNINNVLSVKMDLESQELSKFKGRFLQNQEEISFDLSCVKPILEGSQDMTGLSKKHDKDLEELLSFLAA